MVKLGYSILYVTDVAKSVAFYEASFGFTRKFITPENDYAELATGTTTLAFASITLAKSNLKNGFIASTTHDLPLGMEIALITDDVSATLSAALANGATVVEQPTVKPWGQTVAYMRDIDGFLIELCTDMSTT